MMSNNPDPASAVATGVGRGWLLGLGLFLLFALISGLVYLALQPFDLPENIHMLIAIATGPIVGTVIGLLIAWRFVTRRQQ